MDYSTIAIETNASGGTPSVSAILSDPYTFCKIAANYVFCNRLPAPDRSGAMVSHCSSVLKPFTQGGSHA